jgi:hypothetical protein
MARAFCLARSPIAFARTHFGKHLHYHRSYQLLAVVQLSQVVEAFGTSLVVLI